MAIQNFHETSRRARKNLDGKCPSFDSSPFSLRATSPGGKFSTAIWSAGGVPRITRRNPKSNVQEDAQCMRLWSGVNIIKNVVTSIRSFGDTCGQCADIK